MALRAAARPDLVLSLAVHEPPLPGLLLRDPAARPLAEAWTATIAQAAAHLRAGKVEAAARAMFAMIAPGWWDQAPAGVRERMLANAPAFLGECEDPEAFATGPELLAGVRCPTLLTDGGRSPAAFRRIVDALAAALPGARRHTFPDAGHGVLASHPGPYADALAAFARGEAPPAAAPSL